MTILLEHLEPAKLAKFLATRPVLGQDYVAERERLFYWRNGYKPRP